MSLAEGPFSEWIDEVLWDKIPAMPLGGWFADMVNWAKVELRGMFRAMSDGIESLVDSLTYVLTVTPSVFMVLIFAALALWLKGWKFGLSTVICLGIVAWTPFWEQTMMTLSLVIVASALALLLAIPIGVLASENRWVSRMARPVLDLMQTMPAFVYLIPAVSFFGVGLVPGVLATVVFCMPPGVRLTELGLRQVDTEVVEAGESFGASPAVILGRIKLPLALPTIMAGVNQVIMLALSMVVIAGMVGGDGLGKVIMSALNNVDLARGFNAGLAVVFIAIYLDRISHAIGSRTKVARAQEAMAKS
ncbi:MAG TPA: ABC transporter permease subunit [Candidatus Stackebrandtia excrementipullorum]|nr:ABC transporter permease subunit [Candidatus Stackebrandtia excrementipullorum]